MTRINKKATEYSLFLRLQGINKNKLGIKTGSSIGFKKQTFILVD
tara:strand:+ start:669 stop:803 length:135 start_codon:yes stop_codon:yes gene_type:complete